MLDLLGSNLRRRWKLQSRGTDTRDSLFPFMDLSGSLSSRGGSKGSCHGGFGGGLQLRVCCWCSCLFGYGGVCLGFLRVGEIPMLGLP
ncbi:hypothetical protein Bca4012_073592 [Brassica carinata]